MKTEPKTDPITEPPTTVPPTENNDVSIPQTEQQLVFEKDGFAVYFMGLGTEKKMRDGSLYDYYTVTMKVENNSDSDVTIEYHGLTANGFSMSDAGYAQAPKGVSFEKTFYLEDFFADEISVENFSFVISGFKDEFAENGQPIGTPELFFDNQTIKVTL